MEASALHAPSLTSLPLGASLLRLRSDEQLLALFRAGSEDAFRAIHDRYRQRLFAYARQMLSPSSRQDAEDVMQDVFVRAYGALRADDREVNVRAWLYRVAHNRCIDHLRRPTPPAAEIFEMSRKPLHDPIVEAQRRDDLARLVEDVARLPEQQRSALLMREIDGMSYADLADALDVTVPAVKSLLVRARVGLVEAAEARDTDCCEIRGDLLDAYDRGVKASGRARKHMRSCAGCTEYRAALRGMRRSFAALTPVGMGPLALVANVLGFGGGGAAAGGTAAAGGGAAASGAVAAGGITATCKVAAVVCTAALASGAVEVNRLRSDHRPAPAPAAAVTTAATAKPVALAPPRLAPVPVLHRMRVAPEAPAAERAARRERKRPARPKPAELAPVATLPATEPSATDVSGSGGAVAPADAATPPAEEQPAPAAGADPASGAAPAPAGDAGQPVATAEPDGSGTPPSEH
jgi:RNA polymerase sigma factor (sigma-70 family)